MDKPSTRPFKKDQRVVIADQSHSHAGEHGIITGEVIESTGQLYMEVLDCSHGKTEVVAMPEQISAEPVIVINAVAEAKKSEERKMGRPSTFTQETADELCSYLSIGESLRTACSHEGMPAVKTVFNWFRTHDDFLQQYTRAKEEAAEAMAEEILDIADNGDNDMIEIERSDGSTFEKVNSEVIQRSRLRVETRKWLMAKYKPKRYGDKLDLTSAGEKLQRGASIDDIEAILARAEVEAKERAAKAS